MEQARQLLTPGFAWLPFQMSAYNRFTDIMDILYKKNPEAVEGLDYNGNTPLHDAVKCFNPEGG
jgi:ankyrin repeat protein